MNFLGVRLKYFWESRLDFKRVPLKPLRGLTNCFVLYSTYIVKSGSQSRETVPLSVFNPSLILE